MSMKFTVWKKVDVEVVAVEIVLPVCYGEEDIPNDFPLRDGDKWEATIDIATGTIHEWSSDYPACELYMKVCDGGKYILVDPDGETVAELQDYVPHGVVPGEYGDYVMLKIDSGGVITNWPKSPDVSAFFPREDER